MTTHLFILFIAIRYNDKYFPRKTKYYYKSFVLTIYNWSISVPRPEFRRVSIIGVRENTRNLLL